LPLAIAAILLLALGGGAYAMRDRIPMLQQFMGVPTNAANTSAPQAVLGAGNAVASTTPVQAAPAAALPPVPEPPAAATLAVASAPASAPPPMAQPEDPRYAGKDTTATPTNVAAAPEPAAPSARASEVQPLKELVAARAAEAAPVQRTLAKVTEPESISAPRKPHVPTIAVVAGGDEVITEPAERAIEAALTKHGYHMIDQDTMPRVAHLLGRGKPNIAGMLELLARNGRVDAVVVVHARPAGSENIINRPGPNDIYSVPQNLNYSFTAIERKRTNGQLTLQFAPTDSIKTTGTPYALPPIRPWLAL
jgi:serine/threonine-protein kinase